jgi:hypothetical protein
MKKMPTIFVRDWNGDRSLVTREPHPDCGWVFAGEGVPTRKVDGACCMIRDGKLYKRREVKDGYRVPEGFEQVDVDPVGRKLMGWVPVGEGPEDKWFRAAFDLLDEKYDGTYELVGPNVQGNPELLACHTLVPHGSPGLVFDYELTRSFDCIRNFLEHRDVEGIVFHHPDGRMAKIKKKDFGFKR